MDDPACKRLFSATAAGSRGMMGFGCPWTIRRTSCPGMVRDLLVSFAARGWSDELDFATQVLLPRRFRGTAPESLPRLDGGADDA